MYHWSFVLFPVSKWLHPASHRSWRPKEDNTVQLQDLIYSNISVKQSKKKRKFGSIITEVISAWRLAGKLCRIIHNWYHHSPSFHNPNLQLGKRPISFPSMGVVKPLPTLCDIHGSSEHFKTSKNISICLAHLSVSPELRIKQCTLIMHHGTYLSPHIHLIQLGARPSRLSTIYSIFCKRLPTDSLTA